MRSFAVPREPLAGVDRPRVLSLPPAVPDRPGDFGDRAVQLADLAGLELDPWQQYALRCMLRRGTDGTWAAFESCLLVPRQNGKSVILEAYDLAKLFLSDPGRNGHLILHSAHLFPTAMESFRHLLGLIKNTPELWDEVERVSRAHGEEGIELRNGNRLRFAARTVTGAGRGFSPDDVVLDEAFKMPHEALSALQPALSAKPNPQMVYASSSGYPDSEILWSLVQRGREGGDPTLCYLEWSSDPNLPHATDEDAFWQAVAQANPALGYRITAKKTLAEWQSAVRRGRQEDFDRERLGLWAEQQHDSVFPSGAWSGCGEVDSAFDGWPVFGVAVSVDRRHGSVGVTGRREDGRFHLELVHKSSGTDWIVPELQGFVARNGGAVVVDPSSPAGSLIDEMRSVGIKVYTVTARDYAQACGWLFDAVQAKEVVHREQPELDAAVKDAQLRTLAGGFAWDLREPLSDVTPLVAVTLACWGQRQYGGDPADNIW